MDRGIDDACGFGTEGLQAGTEGNGQKDCPAVRGQRSVPGSAFYGMVRVAEPDFSGQFHCHCVHGGYMGGAGVLSVHEGEDICACRRKYPCDGGRKPSDCLF